MKAIIIGNIISLCAAGFMVASCLVSDKRRVFLFQFLECSILAVASVFFGSLAGATTLILGALRNLVVARDKFTKPVMWFFLILVTVAGLWTNTKGLVGLLPVIATVEYTFCCYYVTGDRETKYSIFVNVLLWVIYSFLILDFSTAISDSIVLLVDTAAIFRLRRKERRAAVPTEQ